MSMTINNGTGRASGSAQTNWLAPVATRADLPMTGNHDGDTRMINDENVAVTWDDTSNTWVDIRGDVYIRPLQGIPATDMDQATQDKLALAHDHANKAVLDGITQTDIDKARGSVQSIVAGVNVSVSEDADGNVTVSAAGGGTAGVQSVTAGSTSIVIGGTASDPTVDVAQSIKDGSAKGATAVQSLTAGSTSVVVGGTATAPTVDVAQGVKDSVTNSHTHANKAVLDKLTQSGAEASIDVSKIANAVQGLIAGTNVTVSGPDANGKWTVNSTASGGSTAPDPTPEMARGQMPGTRKTVTVPSGGAIPRTLYTVPAGVVAYVEHYFAVNTLSTAQTADVKLNGTAIFSRSVAANSSDGDRLGWVLTAGDTLTSANSNVPITLTVVELDAATYPHLKRAIVSVPAQVETTLLTCPAGKTVRLIAEGAGASSTGALVGLMLTAVSTSISNVSVNLTADATTAAADSNAIGAFSTVSSGTQSRLLTPVSLTAGQTLKLRQYGGATYAANVIISYLEV